MMNQNKFHPSSSSSSIFCNSNAPKTRYNFIMLTDCISNLKIKNKTIRLRSQKLSVMFKILRLNLVHFYKYVCMYIYIFTFIDQLFDYFYSIFVLLYIVGRFGGLFYIMKFTLGRFGRQRKEHIEKIKKNFFFKENWFL